MTLEPRAVLVHRRTEYDELLIRHGTAGQARFYLAGRGRSLDEVAARHTAKEQAMAVVAAAVPPTWRRASIERSDLSRFGFEPEDVVVVVGQDGLVANAAKYLRGQPVIGINTDPRRNPGCLVAHPPEAAGPLMLAASQEAADVESRTMVSATTDDGEQMVALNEVYVGHATHQSSRYNLSVAERSEEQSSSGLLVGTGTGSTGWLQSVWRERRCDWGLPAPTAPELAWFVREAWPSPATATTLTCGVVPVGQAVLVQVRGEGLVCFGDGMESDAISLGFGQTVRIQTAPQQLRLVR